MANKNNIKVDLVADVTGFRKSFNQATTQVQLFSRKFSESLSTIGGRQFEGIKTGILAIGATLTAVAAGGVYTFTAAMSAAIEKASQFSTANFQMQSSLDAANRQFDVGSAEEWSGKIKELSATLRIYSETELKNAASRTIDMTKRLGLSAEQMQKVIQISGDLGAGKTDIVGAVERVTSALRGEAEASEYLGLTLNEDYVKGWYAANNATGKAWKDLTDLEKAQIRYQVLLEQATPTLGKAAESVNIYDGALQSTKTSFSDLQKEAGGLVTQNTFVIESLGIAKGMFKDLQTSIAGNRDQLVNLVKDGILTFIDGVSTAIEVMRFFYNGWQGLAVVANGTVLLIVKGMELTVKALRGVLKPLDLLLTGLAKIGIINENPLKNLEETLQGFGKFSADEFNALLNKVTDTNAKFDAAKQVVEEFKKKIGELPAEYKSTTQQMAGDTKTVEQEIKLVNGEWVNVNKTAVEESNKSTSAQLSNIKKIASAIKEIKPVSITSSKKVDGFSTGGNPFFGGLPGYGGGDRRIIAVEDGEHVVRKEATAILGHGFFQKFNSLSFLSNLPKFATGGPIGAVSMHSSNSSPIRHEHNLRSADGSQATVYTDDLNAGRLIGILRRAQVMSS